MSSTLVQLYKHDLLSTLSLASIFTDYNSYLLTPPRFEELDFAELSQIGDIDAEKRIGLFSSGTTGLPKSIFLTKDKIALNASKSIEQFQLNEHSRVLIVASPWHIAGLTWAYGSILANATVEIQIPYVESLSELPSKIDRFKPTHLFTVPGALRSFYNQSWFVEELIIGGASLIEEDYSFLKNRCAYLTQAYGQTESGGLISSLRKSIQDYTANDAKNVGFAPDWITLELDPETSEIRIQSPTSIHPNKHLTGDIGELIDNQLHITGRLSSTGGNCNAITGITMVAHK